MAFSLSQEGLNRIKNHEGLRLTAYKPVAAEKEYTIGYGHYGSDVSAGMTITEERATELLMQDIRKFESFVNNPKFVPQIDQLNQNQFDALVSFAFNAGEGNLQKLTGQGRSLNEIANAMLLYNKGSGQVLPGLIKRRASERELFLSNAPGGTPIVNTGGTSHSGSSAGFGGGETSNAGSSNGQSIFGLGTALGVNLDRMAAISLSVLFGLLLVGAGLFVTFK